MVDLAMPTIGLSLLILVVLGILQPGNLLLQFSDYAYLIVFLSTFIESVFILGFGFPGGYIVLFAAGLTYPGGPLQFWPLVLTGLTACTIGYALDILLSRCGLFGSFHQKALNSLPEYIQVRLQKVAGSSSKIFQFADYRLLLFLTCSYPSFAAALIFIIAKKHSPVSLLAWGALFQAVWIVLWASLGRATGSGLQSESSVSPFMAAVIVAMYAFFLVVRVSSSFSQIRNLNASRQS